ncbi:NAD(P)-dependent alcohol dehydrogenase [Pontivivens insulae]|uniref:Quinone oxidoreductase 1 n=1 Tax=Pontivivens insulae TaxID=1639689 RepID=A0A2R8AGE3_9RHOB|nr:NAD(P)-dependent alcohol dehydrogenase [Pontivivens insulae]RED10650.1 NADPH:quinone reductase-like Zn-dependent oxidoreductase [Pontivivens insulae]SPF31140.1 Quinone oxidoreductase 1 [Pontivivens insulae]
MGTTFNAWNVSRYGGPEVLRSVSCPVHSPAAREVLVRIRASAVSRADSMMRAGQPKFARLFLGLSRPRNGLVGTCFSGDVVAVGDEVTSFHVGDAVFGEAGLQFGANATQICVDETGSLLKKPETISYEEAATLFDGAMTSWHFLTRVAQVQPGETVLILGGSGSLGTAAVQFAKALGANVTASASARNFELVKSLGADQVVDYVSHDPLKASSAYDVVFDTLGVSSFRSAKPALNRGGRYLSPVLGLTLLSDMLLTAAFGRKKAKFAAAGMSKPEVHRAELSEVIALMASNKFSPVMDRTYPLADLVEAHRYVETGRKRGNVVVV